MSGGEVLRSRKRKRRTRRTSTHRRRRARRRKGRRRRRERRRGGRRRERERRRGGGRGGRGGREGRERERREEPKMVRNPHCSLRKCLFELRSEYEVRDTLFSEQLNLFMF